MTDIIVHQVNIAHYRLVELSKLADQAKPFYDWVEKIARQITGHNKTLSEILLSVDKSQIKQIIQACYSNEHEEKPLLFDGVGRVYEHTKACFYFFAWLIRDPPQQRLSPLISRMQKLDSVKKLVADYSEATNRCYLSNKSDVDIAWLKKNHRKIIAMTTGAGRLSSGIIAEFYAPGDDDDIEPGESLPPAKAEIRAAIRSRGTCSQTWPSSQAARGIP
jgi:hypothetical protein